MPKYLNDSRDVELVGARFLMMKASTIASCSTVQSSEISGKNAFSQASFALKNLCHRVLKWAIGDAEIRIWQTSTRTGDTIWHIYDPATGISTTRNSEAEVRLWLEQRYHR